MVNTVFEEGKPIKVTEHQVQPKKVNMRKTCVSNMLFRPKVAYVINIPKTLYSKYSHKKFL